MNILIVDDREENRYMLEVLLRGNGHAVQSVANGVEALEQLGRDKYDLIVSDILMPVMDGFDLCRKVRSDERLRHIPFIIYTATYTGPQDEALAVKIGADRFIIKPCEPDVFMEAIRDMTTYVRHRDEAFEPPQEEEILKLYSERLVRKLEQKMLQLEREVQARLETEKELRISENKYRKLHESMRDGFVYIDMQGFVRESNEVYQRMLGYSPDELSRLTDRDLTPEIWHEYQRNIIANQILVRGFSDVYEKEYRRKDGSIFPVELRSFLIRNDAGEKEGMWAIVRDITERKRAERALRHANDIIVRSPAVAFIWKYSEEWPVEYASENVNRLFGWTAEDFVSGAVRYVSVIFPDDLERVANEVKQSSADPDAGTVAHTPYRIVARDGAVKWVEDITTIRREENGKVVAYEGILIDITDRKRLEQAKTEMELQFHQAQKMESVGRLAGGVAHDFNNLLSIILGYGEMLLRELGKNHPHREPVEQIHKAGIRARDLTKHLLAFSRKQFLEMRTVDVNNVVTGFEKMLRRLIGEDIQLALALNSEPLTVKADPSQLEQVLMNLAVNARDAMPDGGTLTIETAIVELDETYAGKKTDMRPGRYAMIGVNDTGCGMERETMDRLFEPFFTTKSVDRGTGLGLATSYGIIKQHGGEICVYSELGTGTIFKIYLPICTKEDEIQIPSPKPPAPATGSATVLIVEDDPSVRALTGTILAGQGYTVIIADDAKDAIKKAKLHKAPIHLVLTDVIMPTMKGPEVFEKICKHHPEAKVLYMSGYTENVIACHDLLKQGARFVQKPFTVNGLLEKCHQVLHNK
ncbi:MAG TPA: response regulator [bacterium]|nr:response regulator [bacterium]HQO34892.1 response regulator [bacterium]HQP98413.1 response regulator [bacterium]